MGAVDLVIQVESPKSVARGLQRVGRAGHDLALCLEGRIFPKFRADLLESAVVARAMREGEIEETRIPRNPLDVLAQQIVAICADEEIAVDELHELVRGAYPFADLSRAQLENVLDMLAGRYPVRRVRRAATADRLGSHRRSRTWKQRCAAARGHECGHDPRPRALRRVPGRRRRTGWRARRGDGLRGARRARRSCSARRAGGSRRSRAIGCSSPRRRAYRVRLRSGRARASGARRSSARRSGARRVSSPHCRTTAATEALRVEYSLDERAARNLVTFLREQETATGVVPSDRTIVVERFRDEIGDWRVCVLTPFGGRVHAPWAMALRARLRDSLGIDVQSLWSDDGIALHFPDTDVAPPVADLLLDPEEIEELLLVELAQCALYGARFRENAARALLIPRRRPGQRTPLWQQRLKSQSLLQVARRYPQFPIVLETYRECLQDVFDLPALREILTGIHTRRLDLVEVETPSASPFAASLLFEYVATYMYEDDTPPGGTASAGALARPRPPARADGDRGAAGSPRRRRHRGRRALASSVTTQCGRAARPASPRRAARRRRVRPRIRRDARSRASHDSRAVGGRRALRTRLRTPVSSATPSAPSLREACPTSSSSQSSALFGP